MGNIIFSENSAINSLVFGEYQYPVKMLIEKYAETYEQNSIIPNLFVEDKTTTASTSYASMTAMDEFKPVGENGEYVRNGFEVGYVKNSRPIKWTSEFAVSEEMIEDTSSLSFQQAPAAFFAAFERTREGFAAQMFGEALSGNNSFRRNGFEFDTTSADGVNVFSTAHPSSILKNKFTQTNLFSNEFSVDALAELETRMSLFAGDNKEILSVTPDTIIIPADAKLKRDVFAVIGADKDPDTSNNGANYLFGRWTVIVTPLLNQYITDGSKPWILMDSKFNKLYSGAVWNDRKPLTMTSYISHTNDANVWHGRSRFTANFVNWRAFAAGGVPGGTTIPNA